MTIFKPVTLITLTMAFFSLYSAAATEPLELSTERYYAIKTAIGQTKNPVIVFGDSIVEGASLPAAICGRRVVNAGVAGATIEYFWKHAEELLGSSQPSLIVLAVGINNASLIGSQQFTPQYQETSALLSHAGPLAVATITPVRSGGGSVGHDPNLVPVLNEMIKATPKIRGVIDLNATLSSANLTTDGIHLSPDGYALWTKAMIEGIRKAAGC
jgi:hypothetical protein